MAGYQPSPTSSVDVHQRRSRQRLFEHVAVADHVNVADADPTASTITIS